MDQRLSAGASSARTPSRDVCRSDPTASPLQWRRNSKITAALATAAVPIVFMILRRHSVSCTDAHRPQAPIHVSCPDAYLFPNSADTSTGENNPFCLDDIQVHRKKIHKFALNLCILCYRCGTLAAERACHLRCFSHPGHRRSFPRLDGSAKTAAVACASKGICTAFACSASLLSLASILTCRNRPSRSAAW